MENYKNMLANLKDMLNNPTPRIPVGLVLDFSSSMRGEPIAELREGVQQFLDEIRSDDLTLYSAEIGIVTFNSKAECVADFNTADRLQPVFPEANGCTYMGEGIQMTLDMMDQRKEGYKQAGIDYYQPILVVMSDGRPNGDPKVLKAQTERIRELVEKRRLTVIAVGIGNKADMVNLEKLSPENPPIRLSHVQFREFFAWLSASVSRVSASLPGEEQAPDMEKWRQYAEPWPDGKL
ncbi:MAG: VWA domain-containing protein [Eubacteriales bacterium]